MTTAHAVSVVFRFGVTTFWRQVERLAKWALVRAYWHAARSGRHQPVHSEAWRKGSIVGALREQSVQQFAKRLDEHMRRVCVTPRLTARERN